MHSDVGDAAHAGVTGVLARVSDQRCVQNLGAQAAHYYHLINLISIIQVYQAGHSEVSLLSDEAHTLPPAGVGYWLKMYNMFYF